MSMCLPIEWVKWLWFPNKIKVDFIYSVLHHHYKTYEDVSGEDEMMFRKLYCNNLTIQCKINRITLEWMDVSVLVNIIVIIEMQVHIYVKNGCIYSPASCSSCVIWANGCYIYIRENGPTGNKCTEHGMFHFVLQAPWMSFCQFDGVFLTTAS